MSKRYIRQVELDWDRNPSNLHESAILLCDFLIAFKKHNPACFHSWYKIGRTSQKLSKNKVLYNYDNVKKIVYKKDAGSSVRETFYYQTEIWSGAPTKSEIVKLNIAFSGKGNLFNDYSLILELPSRGKVFDYYQDQEHEEQLIDFLAVHWEPESIRVCYNVFQTKA